jgi:hypothetical protein
MRRPSLALLACLTFLALPSAAHARAPVEGRWEMDDGLLELKPGPHGIESDWLRQRSGLSCPDIEDQDGDLHLSGAGRRYTGTWTWSLHKTDGSCVAIGRGPVSIVVAPDDKTAELHGTPPAGYNGSETHALTRPGVRVPPLRKLSQAEQALVATGGLFPGTQLASMPRLQRLPIGFSG